MDILALSFIYTVCVFVLISITQLVNTHHAFTLGEAMTALVLNILEAIAVFVLFRHADFDQAIVIAIAMWASEVISTVYCICRLNQTCTYTKFHALSTLLSVTFTLTTSSMLAFA